MAQNTNLNASPYFDDFDATKNYQRVLFKPGTPIQARELTTLQSILQSQIEKFGKHFFKEGSVVIPGQIAYDPDYFYVQIDPSHLGIPVSLYISELVGKYIKGETSGVRALVQGYITDQESTNGNYTLYVKYQSSSEIDFSTNSFVNGENLILLQDLEYSLSTIRSDSTFATTIVTDAVGSASAAKIENGVYFIRGFFVDVSAQSIILDQYSSFPSYRVGLLINESIVVASQQNPDLFDNARGFSNFAAPGADRFKITATLIKKSLNDLNDEDFIELMRLEDGIIQKFVKETNSTLIRDELARRTYDESGDYYINPFTVNIKESLNDNMGNGGVFGEGQITKSGNLPSEDLMSIQISPGKAYVRGYEIETINTISVDLEKTRTTEKVQNSSVPFTLGRQLELNNVHGSVPIGFDSTSTVKFYSNRTVSGGSASGLEIGVGRVYDFKLKSSEYVNNSTVYETSLYDIQTYVYLNLNATITLQAPAFIEGKNSNASGYLVQNATETNQLILYQVSGTFAQNEEIKINGIDASRTIKSVRDYSISDIKQVVGNGVTFSADTVLSRGIDLSPQGSTFTITGSSGGVSTVTTSSSTFYVGVSTGDIISYSSSGNTVPTYNRVKEVVATSNSIIIEPTTDVVGVSSGSLPGSTINTTNLIKVTPQILNTNQAYLYTELEYDNVAETDLTGSSIVIRKSYSVTVSSGGLNQVLETDTSLTLEPYDEEYYNLSFANGDVEQLNNQKLTVSGRTVSLQNISQDGPARLTVTFLKEDLKPKNKVYNRCSELIVSGSSNTSSGVAGTSLADGLTYNSLYGTRVQDKNICLNVPDVEELLAVYESSDSNDPDLPRLVLTNLNANILNSIKGELVFGQASRAAARLVSNNSTNEVEVVFLNEKTFVTGERVTFKESQITAIVSSFVQGDRDITSSFVLNPNQKPEYSDYSYVTRRSDDSPPTKKLKIIFNNYTIDSNDNGHFVTVDSYAKDRYTSDLPIISNIAASDIIDVRPRVVPFNVSTATKSPFEFGSRVFTTGSNSSPYNFAKGRSINLGYSYYLGRIDKLYLSKDGKFFVNAGVPSLEPKEPNPVDNCLEISTIVIPPYVYDVSDVKNILSSHKRYRMKDISNLEDRLKNVEYYTSLSLLETDTKNLTLRDEQTQLDRFKCGFFVDNFKSIFGGGLGNPAYKCSIDTANGYLRPQHYTTSLDLLLGSEAVIGVGNTSNPDADLRFVTDLGSPNTKKVGDVVCLNYTDVVYFRNNFATRSENVNPFAVVNWIGSIDLSPASDTWVETRVTEKVEDRDGNYQSTIDQLGIDSNTGLSPVNWGAWETNWTGSREAGRQTVESISTGSTVLSTDVSKIQKKKKNNNKNKNNKAKKKGKGKSLVTTTIEEEFTTFENVSTITTTNQSRSGIQYKVNERWDSVNVGDRVVSTDIIHTMRSRNIEFVARRMKPNGLVYPFFDNVDMSSYIIPKLLEVTMASGTFSVGETVTGVSGSVSVRFRLASPNHKYGPYNSPTQTYSQNPYNTTEVVPTSYSTTSTILNVDTASLELQSNSAFYGNIIVGMTLTGASSGAVANITNIRLIADNTGAIIGSLFIPDPTLPSTPKFETGTKTFTLTSSKTNATIIGTTDSTAETNFSSSGTLANVENLTIRTRNADVERLTQSDEREESETTTELQAATSTEVVTSEEVVRTRSIQTPANQKPQKKQPKANQKPEKKQKQQQAKCKELKNRGKNQKRFVDPLAQSFEVVETNGVYITKVEVFFRSKDTTGLPVTMQIRTMQTGLPTQTIVPFGEIVLDPEQVNVSDDASVPTAFTFPSPVYLAPDSQYSVVLLSASNSYNVWISRMGEKDISTINRSESEQIIVSQQPLLGSLFKSQNGATWDPSQLEDLKLVVYRAEFFNGTSTVRFYNPDLNIGNNQIASLQVNPIETISKTVLVGIGRSLTNSEVTTLTPGLTILQYGNSGFSGKLRNVIGAIGISSTLTLTSPGTGFTSNYTVYSNVNLLPITGRGSGGKVNIAVSGGVAIAATVSVGGTGYSYGDTLTVDYSQTGGFGKNLLLSIPNNVGIISSFNTLLLDNVQGNVVVDSSSNLIFVGSGGTSLLAGANVSYSEVVTDGLHFKVKHSNHGMYATNNFVTLSSIQSDQRPQTINSSYTSTSTSDIVLSSVGIFTSFENVPVSNTNPGYILIGDEIIRYTGVTTSTNVLSGITRGIDSTVPSNYAALEQVFKYELNGVSLRRINKTHGFADTNFSKYPIDLDHYYLKVGVSTNGPDRSEGNGNGFPALAFNETKSCGSYDALQLINSYKTPKATQNIPFSVITPNIAIATPQGTTVSARIRTFSGGSPNNNSITPFVDQGFEDIALDTTNYLSSPRIICSEVNENNYLQDYPGKKSFTMEVSLITSDSRVSPLIDLDRVNIITTGNRMNSTVSNYATNPLVNSLLNDPSAASYVTKVVRLERGSDNLKVFFDAYRHSTNDIRVMYRLFRSDSDPTTQLYELFPGYDNLDENKNVINPYDNNGKPDIEVVPSSTLADFRSHEFTAKNLPLFNGFQIKIIMTGTNLAYVPLIRDLRVIASV